MTQTGTDRKPDTIPRGLEDSALIDIKAVRALTGFSSSTPIYNRLRDKAFPEPVHLSRRCTRWRLRDIKAWIEAQTSKVRA